MTRSIIIYPDTNFFLECRVPEECAWSDIVQADVVDLRVCRAVRRELDNHKQNARGRRQDRARRLSSQLRSADQAKQAVVLRKAGPRVTIAAAPIVPRLRNCPPELDRDHPDDRIVCDLLDLSAAAPGEMLLFLTDDGNAAATAEHVGLRVIHIPDGGDDPKRSWKLPPEPDALQKRVSELERQVNGMVSAGPKIAVSFEGSRGPVEFVEVRFVRLLPLGTGEVDQLLGHLETAFPPDVPPEAAVGAPGHPNPFLGGVYPHLPSNTERFGVPAGAIARYRKARAAWLSGLRETLCAIHETLMPTVNAFPVTIRLENVGRQPGMSLLVSVECLGGIALSRVGDRTDSPTRPGFDQPAPPRLDVFGGGGSALALPPILFERQRLPPPARDPHFFHWGPGSRLTFRTMDLECGEFLHGLEQTLELRVLPGSAIMERGAAALKCTVRAANLPEAVVAILPCRFVEVDGNTMELVSGLLNELPRDDPSSVAGPG